MTELQKEQVGNASEGHTDPDERSSRSFGRRALMIGGATAGVGAAAGLVAGTEPAGAETPDAGAKKVVLGKANTATATTSVSMAIDGDSGVEGIDTSSGGGYGLHGTSENGTGIYGVITGDTSGHFAIEGVDASTGSGGGAGISGSSTNGTGVFGVSTNGIGMTGVHTTGSGSGVEGFDESGNKSSRGVYGSSGNGFGVCGVAGNGYGVYGTSTGEAGIGVFGSSSGEASVGVYGLATGEDDYGVFGNATGTGSSYGVYAYSASSDAVYADGSASVTGTLSKGGGSFKIDHPVEPGNKYLYHSFVESPDMKNVYDGTVVLDGDGRATVALPDWFEALNRDYRYQLTAIGSFAPLYISEKVVEGKFSIAGGNAGQEVSWQVTGIRQDAWANANRIPVEVDKKQEDQGRYLHPELFGGEAITALAKARDRAHRHRSSAPTI